MKYTVVWKPTAERELAQIWTEAADRNSVTAAAAEIDRLLQWNPHEQGESRSGKMRIMFVTPLGVFFHVDESDRIVSVVRMWSIG